MMDANDGRGRNFDPDDDEEESTWASVGAVTLGTMGTVGTFRTPGGSTYEGLFQTNSNRYISHPLAEVENGSMENSCRGAEGDDLVHKVVDVLAPPSTPRTAPTSFSSLSNEEGADGKSRSPSLLPHQQDDNGNLLYDDCVSEDDTIDDVSSLGVPRELRPAESTRSARHVNSDSLQTHRRSSEHVDLSFDFTALMLGPCPTATSGGGSTIASVAGGGGSIATTKPIASRKRKKRGHAPKWISDSRPAIKALLAFAVVSLFLGVALLVATFAFRWRPCGISVTEKRDGGAVDGTEGEEGGGRGVDEVVPGELPPLDQGSLDSTASSEAEMGNNIGVVKEGSGLTGSDSDIEEHPRPATSVDEEYEMTDEVVAEGLFVKKGGDLQSHDHNTSQDDSATQVGVTSAESLPKKMHKDDNLSSSTASPSSGGVFQNADSGAGDEMSKEMTSAPSDSTETPWWGKKERQYRSSQTQMLHTPPSPVSSVVLATVACGGDADCPGGLVCCGDYGRWCTEETAASCASLETGRSNKKEGEGRNVFEGKDQI